MKKIGIVTYHRAINYGAVLQSYALQHYIIVANYNVETIDYRCPAIDIQYKFKGPRKSSSLLNFFAHNITCFFRVLKKRRFNRFVDKYLQLSSKYSPNNIKDCTKYDVLISGSDQVFNPTCNDSDPIYLLDFDENAVKYSYAASLGSIIQFNSSKSDTTKLLNKFKCVSLREQSSVDYLSNVLHTKTVLSVDPVWLLTKEEWSSIFNESKKRPYILVYNLMDYKYMKSFVKSFSKQKHLRVIAINRTIMGDVMYFGCSSIKSNVSPNQFLELIKGSEYFITDSFHGTSFAIIFEKPFGVFLSKKKDNTNSRLFNLLGLTSLQDRVANCEEFNIDNPIDFKVAKANMSSIIAESKNYIQSICSDED